MCNSGKISTMGFPRREYYCKSGYFLQIQPDGEVSGVDRSGHENAVFEVTSITYGVIALKAVHSGLYLAVDEEGRVHGQAQLDASCELVEKFDPSGRYTVFQPRRFAAEGWHLALGRQGQARPAHKIDDDQKCAWFIPWAAGGGTEGNGGAGHGAAGPGGDAADLDPDFLEKLGFTSATGLGSLK